MRGMKRALWAQRKDRAASRQNKVRLRRREVTMLITLLSAGLLMGAYFLLLYAGVGLIQDKRFFSSISP